MKKNNTKKVIAALSAIAFMACMPITAYAADSAEVYVTISDSGSLALAQEKITVTDIDSDGALTINDAITIAHDLHCEGGFASEQTEYGLSMTKLWGNDCGSYGYYVNNVSAMSLADPVADGDFISAYSFSDLEAWSDAYCFFDMNMAETTGELALTLSYAGYDENWNPVTLPVSGAVITIDGETTDTVTDAEGKVTVSIENSGVHIISAVSDTQILVPPVCRVTVADGATQSPETGNGVNGIITVGVCALAAAVCSKKHGR